MERIKVEIFGTNYRAEFPCNVCGGKYTKESLVAVVLSDPCKGFRVCPKCLKSRDFDEKLSEQAERLEAQAMALRALVGMLDVPTFAEWKTAYKKRY